MCLTPYPNHETTNSNCDQEIQAIMRILYDLNGMINKMMLTCRKRRDYPGEKAKVNWFDEDPCT